MAAPPERKLLPLTVVGSYPPPDWYRQVLLERAAGRGTPAIAQEAARDAALVTLVGQRQAGIDLPTDGEMGRMLTAPDPGVALEGTVGFLWGVLARLEGVTHEAAATGRRFQIAGTPAAPHGLGIAQEFAAAAALDDGHLKATLPGPFSMALTLCGDADAPAFGDTLAAVLGILRAELEALVAAGAGDVQLDEPVLGMPMGVNPERWVRAFNGLVEGLPLRMHLHVCFRNLLGGTRAVPRTYRHLMPYLNDLHAHTLHLEYSLNDMRELELLATIGYEKQLAIGVVDAHDPSVEAPRAVAERIRAAMRHVDAARLWLAPDCGLSALSREVAGAKLATLAEGAGLVRDELSRGRR